MLRSFLRAGGRNPHGTRHALLAVFLACLPVFSHAHSADHERLPGSDALESCVVCGLGAAFADDAALPPTATRFDASAPASSPIGRTGAGRRGAHSLHSPHTPRAPPAP